MTIDPTAGRESLRRRPAFDGIHPQMRRAMPLLVAVSIRDGLLIALILHAVFTVIFSPRRHQ